MSVTFFIMTQKGFFVLSDLIKKGLIEMVELVVIGKDSQVQNDFSKEIEDLCVSNNLNYTWNNLPVEIQSVYSIAISWRWLIVQKKSKLIVLHDSLLPKYRGFAPLVNSLINGESEIGVTAIFASDEYDRGEVILQKKAVISYPLKIEHAIDRITPLYSEIVLEILYDLKNKFCLKSIPQKEDEASYSLWREEEDYKIDWSKCSHEIERFVNAVGNPYKGASALMEFEKIRIQDVSIIQDVAIMNRDVGKIIFFDDKKPVVVCGEGLLKIINATFDSTGKSIFPLKKFRIKFK